MYDNRPPHTSEWVGHSLWLPPIPSTSNWHWANNSGTVTYMEARLVTGSHGTGVISLAWCTWICIQVGVPWIDHSTWGSSSHSPPPRPASSCLCFVCLCVLDHACVCAFMCVSVCCWYVLLCVCMQSRGGVWKQLEQLPPSMCVYPIVLHTRLV